MKIILILCSLFVGQSLFAEDATFDQCVHALYRQGGLELRISQIECLKKISPQIQRCQNSLFLEQFIEPNKALSECKRNSEASNTDGDINFYHGKFEETPTLEKKTICSITVNSDNEREAFRKKADPRLYNWVELLPARENERFIVRDNNWLQRACKQKIKCDTLVVSGHFAEAFIGESGFEISAKSLLDFSCGEACSDFFKSIKEVYLFGCNTLASKASDSRSVDQYVQILTEDGLPPHHAQRIAARRYTAYGTDYATIMRSVFPNAKNIYGFPSVGPSGKSVEPTLNKYLTELYNSNVSSDKIYQKTLGKTGMIRMTGDSRPMCGTKDSIMQNISQQAQIEKYAETYGNSIPVAVVDMLLEGLSKKIIDQTVYDQQKNMIIKKWSALTSTEKQIRLCPLILAGQDNWIPKNIDCFTKNNWLKGKN